MPGGLPLGIFVLVGSRQHHRVTDFLSEFYHKYRSLTAHYPIELHEDSRECSEAAHGSLWS